MLGASTIGVMAPYFVRAPGDSHFSPCAEHCKHGSCASARSIAESVCRNCSKAIGYDVGVEFSVVGAGVLGIAHDKCRGGS